MEMLVLRENKYLQNIMHFSVFIHFVNYCIEGKVSFVREKIKLQKIMHFSVFIHFVNY